MQSEIDNIFNEIFGNTPKKSGTAFEQLSAIVTHILWGGEVIHDARIRGEFSETSYQIDVQHKSGLLTSMGEAKDYSIQGGKVGRGDLQKLGGALPDLKEVNSGVFFSATGYTTPAKKYAQSSENIIKKPITLYGLRPSTDLDEQGFIKTVIVNLYIESPDHKNSKWQPHFTEKGNNALKALLTDNQKSISIQEGLSFFYDSSGNKILSLYELTEKGFCEANLETKKSHACFLLRDHYIKVRNILVEICGLEYEIQYIHEELQLRITDDREARLVLLDKEGNVIALLTDDALRKYGFDDAGKVVEL